jgi:hypothetical protein
MIAGQFLFTLLSISVAGFAILVPELRFDVDVFASVGSASYHNNQLYDHVLYDPIKITHTFMSHLVSRCKGEERREKQKEDMVAYHSSRATRLHALPPI